MEQFLFSEKNIDFQAKLLMKQLDLPTNPMIHQKCKSLVSKFIQNGLEKYKKPQNMADDLYIRSLNKKCIDNCILFYNSRKQQKSGDINSQQQSQSNSQIRQRPTQLQQQNKQQNKQQNQPQNKPQKKELEYFDNENKNSNGSYATFDNVDENCYVSATGEVIRGQMQMNNNEEDDVQSMNEQIRNARTDMHMQFNKKNMENHDKMINSQFVSQRVSKPSIKGNVNEMMQQALALRNNYDSNQKRKPEEINFALDGGDSRNMGRSSNNQSSGEFMGAMDGGDNDALFGMLNEQESRNANPIRSGHSDLDAMMRDRNYDNRNQQPNRNQQINRNSETFDENMMMQFKKWLQEQQNSQQLLQQQLPQKRNFNTTENIDNLLKQTIADRSYVDKSIEQMSKNNQQPKFDPMKSPHDDNQSNFFFDKIMNKIKSLIDNESAIMTDSQFDAIMEIYKKALIFAKKNKSTNKIKRNNQRDGQQRSRQQTSQQVNQQINQQVNQQVNQQTSQQVNQQVNQQYNQQDNNNKIDLVQPLVEPNQLQKWNVNDKTNTISIIPNCENSNESEYETFEYKTFGYYNLDELINIIQNDIFNANNINVSIRLNIDTNRIEIKSDNPFKIKIFDDSLLKLLGFTKIYYENSNEYIAEATPNIDCNL